MSSDTDNATQLTPRSLPRRGAGILLRSAVTSVAICVAYFVVPMTSTLTGTGVVELILGLIGLTMLLTWQIRAIVRSPHPVARAIEAMATFVPLFLAIFASTYYLMGQAEPSSWSEPLSRLDAAYFAVTIFATVGFGDITPVSDAARAVATLQMIVDVILVGLAARVLVGAVKEGLRRQGH
jgi:Na+-transporting methylmalonyl-CoA/oxaloacetate decarboxylase gamma subunit